MTIYRLSKRNLPYQIMVWKEIGRRLLSSKNYSRLLKHKVVLKKIKNYEWFNNNGYTNASGQYNNWRKELVVRTSNNDLLARNPIYVFVHEFAHMVWDYDRRVDRKRTKVHAKAFKNLENRLWTKYKTEVKPKLPEIIKECQDKELSFMEAKKNKKLVLEKKEIEKNSIEYKLERVLELKKKWKTKEKRVNNALKKLNRKEKLYNTLLSKR